MSLLHLLSYVGIIAAAGFIVLSLASGLLWISELIEEHSRTAKTVGIRAVYAIIVIHVLLYFTDSLPFLQTLFSIICHVVYLQNFSHTWPFISLASLAFVASCALAIVNHFVWFFYFSHLSREARARAQRGYRGGTQGSGMNDAPGFTDIATFFALCVWLVPLFLFLSLSANDNALPVSADGLNSPTTYAPSQLISTSRSSLFKSILDLLPFLRRRGDRSEGLLVSHTPTPSAPNTPRTSYSEQNPHFMSPRTSFDTAYPASLALQPPPRRSKTGSSVTISSRKPEDGVAVVNHNSSLLVSRTVSEETPCHARHYTLKSNSVLPFVRKHCEVANTGTMSSPSASNLLSSSPSRSIRVDLVHPHPNRAGTGGSHGDEHPRRSPTLVRTADPNDPTAQERQRSLDVDSAMQLSRARSNSVAVTQSAFVASPASAGAQPVTIPQPSPSPKPIAMEMDTSPHYPFLPPGPGDFEEGEGGHGGNTGGDGMAHHLSQGHDPSLLVSLGPTGQNESMPGLPLYQASNYRSSFDYSLMEGFAAEEKKKLGISSPPPRTSAAAISSRIVSSATTPPPSSIPEPNQRPGEQPEQPGAPVQQGLFVPADGNREVTDSSSVRLRHRKLSLSNTRRPRARRQGGKMALFEGTSGAPPPSFGLPGTSTPGRYSPRPSLEQAPADDNGGPSRLPPPLYSQTGHERPYRFSFYSNSLSATIHARSLSELPAEGQSFEDLFTGIGTRSGDKDDYFGGLNKAKPGENMNGFKSNKRDGSTRNLQEDDELCAWWLDIMSPTDEEMKLLSKVFSIHPLTTEDIQMEETREKIELFRNYYLVCFRSFDQDPYSPTYLEPLNMYIIVFREGTLSFHFRPTPHPQNVRRRIKQLKDYINVTSDWISYALIDDITDAFGPLIQNIEYEVDSIDELVLILKEAEQSDMLRRIGTCRKKVMGLLRLMGNKADVVKGLAKRCNENWSIAPKSDIGLYLSDIQDHLITMTQNLNHYEKILSRSHSNYLAQISIEMTDANNQINDVLSKLTALGTVLIPMNLVTGLWGMNVHVPGEDVQTGYTWFVSIIGGLVGFACIGGFLTYKLMRR